MSGGNLHPAYRSRAICEQECLNDPTCVANDWKHWSNYYTENMCWHHVKLNAISLLAFDLIIVKSRTCKNGEFDYRY